MTRDDRLAELLERWEAAAAAGLPPTPEDVCRDSPDDLAAFRELLRQLGRIGMVKGGGPRDGTAPAAGFRAGRYFAQEFHAAGGLGVVYRARDEELNRPVALKCLRAHAPADSPVGRRFLLEAEVTSRLEHPGIAPVHGRGQTADGRPFYAMRFIEGETLQDAARRSHSPNQQSPSERNVELHRLLRAFVGVCQTVAYAHSKGVIHRDLKPANVMVGPFGEVLVMDWGLATEPRAGRGKTEDPPTVSYSDDRTPHPELMVDGRVKGSPAFMSPEQARGDWERVGPASDVYSLGSTLYYLLTGHAPYEGRTGVDVVAKVRAGRYQTPREIKADVPRALESVCRKAMAFAPSERYETPSALAEDVERWLADEPLTAWREPFAVRARRWMRRHRTLVTATAAALGVGFLLVAVTGYRLDRKNVQLAQANEREVGLRLAAEEQKRLADERFTLALDSTTHLVTDVQAKLVRSPATRAVRESILRDAIARLDGLVKSTDPTRDADRVAIKARLQLGDLYREMDQDPTRAAAEYARAVELARAARERQPDDADTALEMVDALHKLVAAEETVGRFAAARDHLTEATPLIDAVGPPAERARARNLEYRGRFAIETGDAPAALTQFTEARGILQTRNDPDSQFALGEVLLALGEAAYRAGRFTDAVAHHATALAKWRELESRRPGDVTVKRKLALTHGGLTRALGELGNREAAGAHARAFFDLAKALADQDPDNLEAVRELATAHAGLALDAALRFDVAAADAQFARSLELVDRVAAADRKNLSAWRDHAVVRGKLAQVARARRQYPEAATRFGDAIAIAKDILATAPDRLLSRADLAHWLMDLGQHHLRYLPDKEAGFNALTASRNEWETVVRTDSTNLAWQARALEVYRLIGGAYRTTRKALDRADEAYAAGLAAADRIPPADRQHPIVRRQVGLLRVEAAGLLFDQRKPTEAVAAAERELEALTRAQPDAVTLEVLERIHALLADLHRKTNSTKSEEHTRRAADAARRGLALEPDRPEFRRALMLHRAFLADRRMAESPAGALALLRQALADAPHLPPDLAETTTLRNQLAGYEARAGDCCEMLNRPKDAAQHYTRALDLHTRVVEAEPTARPVLAYDHRRLAELKLWQLDFAGSATEYEKAQAVLDRLTADKVPFGPLDQQSAKLIAANRPFVKSLPQGIETLEATLKQPADVRLDALRLRVMWLLSKDRDHEAAETAAALAHEKAANGDALARAAVEFARLAGRPSGARYADGAMELLKQAQAAGYFRDPTAGSWLTWEPLFEPLRAKVTFRALVNEVQKK